MNKSDFDFCKKVSDIVARTVFFPVDICDWIGCQFALESSFGSSMLAKVDNNFCGMRNPMIRPSCSVFRSQSNVHWAHFVSLEACVFDYLLCITYHKPLGSQIDTLESYRCFIKRVYCPEKDYIDKINSIYKQFKTLQK